ncbi:unnamed protein product [Rotaria sp. Silwood2]|nr:unnamed protein product [Rotaria sp. Silwood2]CAF4456720.1 unnamed protein product [Rotaria sp. Silwood2]CAF4501025.1 unnamed protein product [Rotaria sp. Silwood2]
MPCAESTPTIRLACGKSSKATRPGPQAKSSTSVVFTSNGYILRILVAHRLANSASQNKYWHNCMCKGSFSVDNTTDQPTIEANMTLQSRRLQKARSFHTKRNRSLSANRRSQSTSGTHDTFINECQTDPTFAESL